MQNVLSLTLRIYPTQKYKLIEAIPLVETMALSMRQMITIYVKIWMHKKFILVRLS